MVLCFILMSSTSEDKRKQVTPNQDAFFLSEVSNFCPLCNEPMQYVKGKSRYKNYEIAHIYPCNPTPIEEILLKDCPRLGIDTEDEENKIAICIKCHNQFDNPRTVEEYMKLYNLKRNLISSRTVRTMFNELPVQEEIIQIITSLIYLSGSEGTELSLDSIEVKNKISEPLLCQKITNYVAEYYTFIDNGFRNLNIGDAKYREILCTFKLAYLKISAKSTSQEEIFNNLVNWLSTKSGISSRIPNEIVISYFVQHCEVFNAITK